MQLEAAYPNLFTHVAQHVNECSVESPPIRQSEGFEQMVWTSLCVTACTLYKDQVCTSPCDSPL